MARAQLLLLTDEGRVREGGLHHARLMAHHHQHAPVEHGADGFQHIAQHGFTQDGLQYFGFVGMHAGALARGQNEGGSLQHGGSLRKRWGENSPSARKGQADGYGGEESPFGQVPPFPSHSPFPPRKRLLWRMTGGMGARSGHTAAGPRLGERIGGIVRTCFGGKALPRFGHSDGAQRRAGYEKGGPEGPPLLCGSSRQAGRQTCRNGFVQAQAFWKTNSPSRTSIWTV